MKKQIVAYPAELIPDKEAPQTYTVIFPDVPGAISQGTGIAEAISNGSEALGLILYDEKELPKPSDPESIQPDEPGTIINWIATDLEEIKRTVREPTVKKNTTIPGDLARMAEQKNINFSALLTDALKAKLNQ
ncbi:toxin-antitoxin system, antitoxin component, HicB family [Lentilactobacillus rapi DSM 19907 = JCM 15042]|uniref:Antitoxin HicB n=2 Tax=Lentilactobacillus rapi TaxID=481723 RepID=A0A512PRB9_9LACO|nr:type II toxin-antitoxin system HicB family antitoxin [Lentilactobacillus rapi]KRL17377.1 toxin-antitoxin system, antitoxin component, HicB family [Lentilactobacillus rapi DSM 19907 = JCM 15042]GEP73734.1 antitoxin HicB [Lentilactobacillus rapi]